MQKKRLIKNYLLYPKFQLRLVFYFVVITLVNLLLYFAANQYFFNVFRQKGKELGIPASHIFFTFISQLESEMAVILGGVTLFSLLMVTIIGIAISHKVAGPLYRFSSDLSEMVQKKKLNKIKFRDKDYLADIEKDFNEIVDISNSR